MWGVGGFHFGFGEGRCKKLTSFGLTRVCGPIRVSTLVGSNCTGRHLLVSDGTYQFRSQNALCLPSVKDHGHSSECLVLVVLSRVLLFTRPINKSMYRGSLVHWYVAGSILPWSAVLRRGIFLLPFAICD